MDGTTCQNKHLSARSSKRPSISMRSSVFPEVKGLLNGLFAACTSKPKKYLLPEVLGRVVI